MNQLGGQAGWVILYVACVAFGVGGGGLGEIEKHSFPSSFASSHRPTLSRHTPAIHAIPYKSDIPHSFENYANCTPIENNFPSPFISLVLFASMTSISFQYSTSSYNLWIHRVAYRNKLTSAIFNDT